MSTNQFQGIVITEIGIGFVHHQNPLQMGRQFIDEGKGEGEAEGGVGVGEKEDLALKGGQWLFEFQLGGEPEGTNSGALNLRQCQVVGVGGMDVADFFPFAGKAADQIVEDLVGAVGHDDPFRRKTVNPGCFLAGGEAFGVGVSAQVGSRFFADGGDDLGGGRIGVLVGVELDEALRLGGLKTGHVSGHPGDVGTHRIHAASACFSRKTPACAAGERRLRGLFCRSTVVIS